MTKNLSDYEINKQKRKQEDDPYAKNQMVKCSICGSAALQDKYGNGECKNCGWKFSKNEKKFEQDMGISYPMLVSPTTAKAQYKAKLPFKATFEEFVNGLKFYSEMTFTYKNKRYGVFFYRNKLLSAKTLQEFDGIVEFFEDKVNTSLVKFKSISEFKDKAHINGKLLKDLWNDVSFAGFMYCE